MISTEQASRFAKLALKGIHKEYPNKLDHVINGEGDLRSPRALHPAFYGCFDWHSSVHSHWMLVRLLRLLPNMPNAHSIRAALGESLTSENLQAEKSYLDGPNRRSFERTYGWAWLLKLAEELYGWEDADGARWSGNLQPLAGVFTQMYLGFLPRQTYPIRTGTHPNTAFGMGLALDYARTAGDAMLESVLIGRGLSYYSADVDYPARLEPDGNSFLSPALIEADLMQRILPADEFASWFHRFLPGIDKGEPWTLLNPATVSDRTDPQIVHLDGLNLSRAWCMRNIATALPASDPARQTLNSAADMHAEAALPHIASGDYMGEHWLATFAVYMLSQQEGNR